MRIAIWTGAYQYWEHVHPDNLWKPDAPMMAGSEITAMSIALELAEQGHDVLLGCKTNYPETFGRLRTVPLDLFQATVFAERYHALVSWDDPHLYRFCFEHIPVHLVAYELNHTFCGVYQHVIDAHLHPSQWHARRYREEFGVPEEDQVVGLTNGVGTYMHEKETFPEWPQRRPYVLWCSSPDRGLDHLLRIWPRIREEVADAELHIYYNMDRWMGGINEALSIGIQYPTTGRALEIQRLLQPMVQGPDVTYHGGVSHVRMLDAMLEASVLAYTCDPVAPTECFSMVMLEAIVAGMNVIASDADALPELWGAYECTTILPLPIDDDLWADAVIKALHNRPAPAPNPIPEEYTFAYLAKEWAGLIKRLL